MAERLCPNGCGPECFEIWEERVEEIQAKVRAQVRREQKNRRDENHATANQPVHKGAMEPIASMLDISLWAGAQPPRRRSHMTYIASIGGDAE